MSDQDWAAVRGMVLLRMSGQAMSHAGLRQCIAAMHEDESRYNEIVRDLYANRLPTFSMCIPNLAPSKDTAHVRPALGSTPR